MLRQTLAITGVNLNNVRHRLGASSVIIIGTACVVAVMCGMLALASGLTAATQSASHDNRGVVMRNGSLTEQTSYYTGEAVGRLLQLDQVVHASGELLIYLNQPAVDGREPAPLLLRAIDQHWQKVRPEISIVKGRLFQRGKREVIVGRALLDDYPHFTIGATLPVYLGKLDIVGHFEADSGFAESELLADIAVLRDQYRRGNVVNVVRVTIDKPASRPDIQTAIDADPANGVTLVMEADLHAQHVAERQAMIEAFSYWILAIMALGAVVASLATMFAAVDARSREIATLRALGFGRAPIVASVLAEAFLLALIGGLMGTAVVYFQFDGVLTSTRNALGTNLAFAFQITPRGIAVALFTALVLGLIGGAAAAFRATSIPLGRTLASR